MYDYLYPLVKDKRDEVGSSKSGRGKIMIRSIGLEEE